MKLKEKFVSDIYQQVSVNGITSIVSLLTSPPGRKPKEELKEISRYFNDKSKEEKEIIEKIIKLSVNSAIFDMLCILDNINNIDQNIDYLKLVANKNNKEILLNDIKDQYLHDLFNIEIGNVS